MNNQRVPWAGQLADKGKIGVFEKSGYAKVSFPEVLGITQKIEFFLLSFQSYRRRTLLAIAFLSLLFQNNSLKKCLIMLKKKIMMEVMMIMDQLQ